MRSLKAIILGLVMIASSAFAAPVVYTVPSTTLGDGTTIVSGTYTYDSTSTPRLTNINITATGTNPGSYTFLGAPSADIFGQLVASITSGAKVVYIAQTGSSTALIGIANCASVTSGLCVGGNNITNASVTVTSAPAPIAAPAAIPTLSEWAMIFMASLMAMFGIRKMRRSK